MRTIIVNTIGERMQRNRLFFLPFREDELIWLDCELTQPEQCVREISQLLERQNTRQDYHMVVLTDLSVFGETKYEHIRKACQQLMRAYWNECLLRPMAERRLDLPWGVTEVFLYSGARNNHGGVAEDKVLSQLLPLERWSESQGALTMRFFRHGQEFALDVSPLFREYLQDFRKKRGGSQPEDHAEEPADEFHALLHGEGNYREEKSRQPQEETEKRWLKELEQLIKSRLAELQDFRFELGGDRGEAQLSIYEQLFPINDGHPELVYADLQLNLSRYIEKLSRWNGAGAPTQISLTPHSAREFKDILNRAERRLELAQQNKPQQTYYKLESPGLEVDVSEVEAEILAKLEEHTQDIYGVADALSQEPLPMDHLDRGWFLIGREIRRFQELFDKLKEQYDENAVRKNQSAILDLCADRFHAWRSAHAEKGGTVQPNATEHTRPRMQLKELREELNQEQEAYFHANVAELADYDDVRREAVDIWNRFECLARFWSPKTRGHDLAHFRKFSLVMAVIFLVIMILPYGLMEWGQPDVGIPKYLWFLVSLGWFAIAYGVSLVYWLHQLRKKLRECTLELYHLMQTSTQRRRESILMAVRIYGTILPTCFRDSERLRRLEELDRKNEEKEKNYSWHDRILKDALYELRELRSALRLERETEPLDPVDHMKPLDYDQPPWEGTNREAYLLFQD